MLIVHGDQDTMVAPHNSRNLAAVLRGRGVPVTLKMYPRLMHGDTIAALSLPARRRASTLADIAAFVNSPKGQAAFDAATEGMA